MAFTRVQGGSFEDFNPTASIAVTISAVGSGNTICGIVSFEKDVGGDVLASGSVTDDKGNTYHLETSVLDTTNSPGQYLCAFSRTNITNAPTTITANFTNSAWNRKILVDEFSGGSTASTDERDGTAHGGQFQTAPGTGTDAVTSGTFTTSTNGDLIWGGCIAIATTTVCSNGTSFSTGTQDTGNYSGQTEYRTQATAGSGTAATFTHAVDTQRITFMIAIKPAAAGGAAPPNGWWRDESDILPRPPVRFAAPPPAFVSTFRAAVISGTAWHRDFPEANPRPPIRFQPPPAFVSTFKTAVISGIAFSRNEPESNPRLPRRFEIPPASAPQPIGQVVTAPPNGWWRNESEILPRAPIRFAPPGVFISTFQTAPISGIAWFEPPDQNRAPAKAPIDYPAPILLPTAPPPTGWWTQSDKVPTKRQNTSDPPSFVFPQVVVTWSFAVSDTIKARVPPRDEPPAFGQPPATTPVGISGMAWFAPWPPDIINRGVNWLTAPAWAPQFIDQVVPPPPVVSPLDRHFICDVGRLMGWG